MSKNKKIQDQSWYERHINDPFVKKAQELNRLSRSSFKIDEIQEKFALFQKNQYILDCGAAPGGWSQRLALFTGSSSTKKNQTPHLKIDLPESQNTLEPPAQAHGLLKKPLILAVDLLPIQPIEGVCSWQKDLNDPELISALMSYSDQKKFNHIVSDAMSNVTGYRSFDETQWECIFHSIKTIAQHCLKKNGSFVVKLWRSHQKSATLLHPLSFKKITLFKPKSSRKESSEIYLIAQGLL